MHWSPGDCGCACGGGGSMLGMKNDRPALHTPPALFWAGLLGWKSLVLHQALMKRLQSLGCCRIPELGSASQSFLWTSCGLGSQRHTGEQTSSYAVTEGGQQGTLQYVQMS